MAIQIQNCGFPEVQGYPELDPYDDFFSRERIALRTSDDERVYWDYRYARAVVWGENSRFLTEEEETWLSDALGVYGYTTRDFNAINATQPI